MPPTAACCPTGPVPRPPRPPGIPVWAATFVGALPQSGVNPPAPSVVPGVPGGPGVPDVSGVPGDPTATQATVHSKPVVPGVPGLPACPCMTCDPTGAKRRWEDTSWNPSQGPPEFFVIHTDPSKEFHCYPQIVMGGDQWTIPPLRPEEWPDWWQHVGNHRGGLSEVNNDWGGYGRWRTTGDCLQWYWRTFPTGIPPLNPLDMATLHLSPARGTLSRSRTPSPSRRSRSRTRHRGRSGDRKPK